MSASNFDFLIDTDPPSHDKVEDMCLQAKEQTKDECRGIPFYKAPNGPIVAWVKYGRYVTVSEALTQDWVARTLGPAGPVRVPRVYDAWVSSTHPFGVIVMEYIDAPDCEDSPNDVALVAEAVKWLIGVQAPNSVPGPVGGGPVIHPFFHDWVSGITYHTVDELQDHVNGILEVIDTFGRVGRVDFKADNFCLCPSDISPGNFKKDRDGKVIALDFGATCFLPRSFLDFSMAAVAVNKFAWQVAYYVIPGYQASNNVKSMAYASAHLVFRCKNTIGLPRSICKRMSHT